MRNLSQLFDTNAHDPQRTLLPNARLVKDCLSDWYWRKWDNIRQKNRKLSFYNQIKDQPGFDEYVDTRHATTLAKLRASSHHLKIETGRHQGIPRHLRYCNHCCSTENIELLCSMPFADPIIQDEWHMLNECQFTQSARARLNCADKATLHSLKLPSHTNIDLMHLIETIIIHRH